jgi:hypothetical protein
MSVIGSLVGGILGSNAAGQAASTESAAAQQAQNLEKQNQTAALSAQTGALSSTTAAEQPYQSLGSTSANSLANLLQQGFQAPTLQQAQQTPGYQFQLQQGTNAIDEGAAATGNLMSGTTGTALQQFGQGLGQSAYQQTYQNALNQYMANTQSLQGGANLGLSSTGQLASANQASAQNTGNIDLTSAQQQAQQINNAAAARASGYLGQAGAISNAVGGVASGFGNMSSDSSLGENLQNFAFA